MIEITNLVTPSAEWWDAAIKGMRNPFKSRFNSDSGICFKMDSYNELCDDCLHVDYWEDEEPYSRPMCEYDNPYDKSAVFVLGREDKKLLLNLCKAGTSHRKVLRQLPVIMDIKAPLYFWKQLDQYKLGTVTNSESTMHTLANKEFELSDFSLNYLSDNYCNVATSEDEFLEYYLIPTLNSLRERYFLFKHNIGGFINSNRVTEEKSKECWYALNELLPQSYLQTRTWSANYEVLVNIIQQRKGHKLDEWQELINYWLENVPYLREIMEAVNESDKS